MILEFLVFLHTLTHFFRRLNDVYKAKRKSNALQNARSLYLYLVFFFGRLVIQMIILSAAYRSHHP